MRVGYLALPAMIRGGPEHTVGFRCTWYGTPHATSFKSNFPTQTVTPPSPKHHPLSDFSSRRGGVLGELLGLEDPFSADFGDRPGEWREVEYGVHPCVEPL